MTGLLTEAEAAKALQLCTRTLRKARQRGQLSYVLIGRVIRYAQSDLDSFIDASRQDNPPCKPQPTRHVARAKSGKIIPFTAQR